MSDAHNMIKRHPKLPIASVRKRCGGEADLTVAGHVQVQTLGSDSAPSQIVAGTTSPGSASTPEQSPETMTAVPDCRSPQRTPPGLFLSSAECLGLGFALAVEGVAAAAAAVEAGAGRRAPGI